MKLRTKLTALSILLIVAAIAVCCALLLTFAQERDMEAVAEAGLADYKSFYYAFLQSVSGELPAQAAVRRSYLIGAFRSVKGFSEFTLQQGGDMLCNNAGFDAAGVFRDDGGASTGGDLDIRYRTVRADGADYFVANAVLAVGADRFDVSLARNITAVTDEIRALAAQCLAVGLTVTALAVAAMWLLVYRSLKPIEKLRAGAAELARGSYEKRIALRGRDELAELAADFNGMADAIEANVAALHETSERQQAFINDLSHELKTPVTSILLCSETLLNRNVPPDALNRSLARIYDQGKWLETLSQKLMTLVLLQGEITMQPESVPELLDAVRETTADALRERGMTLKTTCSMDALPMDFDLMRSALVNLVVNAQRASSDGQTIEIDAHGLTIAVVDHGRGIPKEALARITEPFYMADRSRSKKQGGAGLGLALVKRIAEAHGAALEIDSAANEGTTARIRFGPPK